jgi:esterase/lipase superfamily enzyme
LLLFVHGFNNDMEAVLNRAHQLESLYGVEVLAFSWPANGGGIAGVASYKSDKRDAKTSIGALDRVFEYMEKTLVGFNKDALDVVRRQAQAKFPTDSEKQDRYVASVAERDCPFKVSAMFHSMGNYLYKHLLLSTSSAGTGLIFDNVVLAAADANNAEHALWVDRIRCRSRVYVTINEDDRALSVSRLKSGEDQRARLGHYPYGLDSRQGVYVNFTDVQKVGDSHAYFESQPVTNPRIKRFFLEAFNGGRAESIANLSYDAATNMYRFPKRA